MWEPQMKALTQVFRVIRYDRRGHGKSNVPPAPYTMERFGRDVLAILDDLNIEKVHWCGLSMGGMVGQWLGANAPERFGKLILANTACHYPDPTRWLERIKAVKDGGMAAVADAVIAGWLTQDFRVLTRRDKTTDMLKKDPPPRPPAITLPVSVPLPPLMAELTFDVVDLFEERPYKLDPMDMDRVEDIE
jgi:pimeloyl-ACP methyl ester carboxylesterase